MEEYPEKCPPIIKNLYDAEVVHHCARGANVLKEGRVEGKLDPGRNDDCNYVVVEDPRSVDFCVRQGVREP